MHHNSTRIYIIFCTGEIMRDIHARTPKELNTISNVYRDPFELRFFFFHNCLAWPVATYTLINTINSSMRYKPYQITFMDNFS